MSNRLRDLGLCQAIVHPDIQVTGQLSDLPGGNQRADRDEAAIARRKAGAEPQVTEQNISRVLHDAWKNRAELLTDSLGSVRFSCLQGSPAGPTRPRGRGQSRPALREGAAR